MALVLADRVQETTNTTGTGTLTLAGAVASYQTFGAGIGNGNTTYYTILSGVNWEVGIGTYTSAGTTLSRDTILSSSAAGAAISVAAGALVFGDYPAGKAVSTDTLATPPAIGGTTANTIRGSTVTANASVSGSSTTGAFAYGTLGYSDTNHLATFQTSVNSYSQVEIQNTSNGTTASADMIVANDSTTSTTNYGDFGINSSGFTGTGALSAANNVYLTATTGDLAIGTTTSNKIHMVIAGGATDAVTVDTTGRVAINNSSTNTTPTALLHLGAGTATASTAPLKFTSGTNLTTAEAGVHEYDGVNFYATTDTSMGRNVVPQLQQFYLSSNVTAFGPASGDFFGGTSSASLAATTAYDIECFCYFLKTTAGTGQWIPTFSTALTVGHSYLEYTPVTGFTTTVITGAMVTSEATGQTLAVLTHAATASLTTAVNHIAKLRIRVLTNTACNFRLKFVGSAGTITPQAGSWYTVRKVASNAGNFVA